MLNERLDQSQNRIFNNFVNKNKGIIQHNWKDVFANTWIFIQGNIRLHGHFGLLL